MTSWQNRDDRDEPAKMRKLVDCFPTLGWGQAERLACRKRQPNAFLRAEARAHFYGHRPNGKENSSKNSLKTGAASTLCLIRYIKEKGLSFPLVLRRRISRLVWPCESLCDLVGKGSPANTSYPNTRRCEPFVKAVFPHGRGLSLHTIK